MINVNNSQTQFQHMSDDDIIAELECIYSRHPEHNDLEFVSEFPGLEFLKEWAKTGFQEVLLDQAKISPGARKLIKLALYENGVLARESETPEIHLV